MSPSEPSVPSGRHSVEVVEAALAPGGDDGRVVIVGDLSQAEVRFANNTTTTNGVRQSRRVTVISIVAGPNGVAAGSASASGDVDVDELVRRAEGRHRVPTGNR